MQRIGELRQILVTQAEIPERVGPVVFDEHIRPLRGETLQRFAAALGFQVERDRALVRSLGEKAGAHQRPVQAIIGARLAALVGVVRILHLDHVGAKHRKLIGRERAGEHVRAIQYPDAFKRPHERLLGASDSTGDRAVLNIRCRI